MAPFSLNRSYKHIKRYRQIIEVLSRHGFGYLVENLGLFKLLPLRKRIKKDEGKSPARNKADRLRMVFEELGPTFIKFGQILSTRPDILPAEYLEEFTRLQDKVSPVDFSELEVLLEDELEASLEETFREIERKPLAVASIGQVHRGVLPDGSRVVIKIKRPGIEETIFNDLEILHNFAVLIQERLKSFPISNPVEIVEELTKSLKEELNYYNEARNIDRFRNNFKNDNEIYVPRVFWAYTTRNVLTMEEIQGTKLNQMNELKLSRQQKRELARKGARIFLDQIIEYGFFHADPHPGNIILQPDGKLVFLDFGVMGRLSSRIRQIFIQLFLSLIRKDAQGVVEGLMKIGAIKNLPPDGLVDDVEIMIDDYYDRPLQDLRIGDILNELLSLSRKYEINFPRDFILLGKALLTIEGIGKRLDPEFNVIEVAKPYAKKLMLKEFNPRDLAFNTLNDLKEIVDDLAGIPGELRDFLRFIRGGGFELKLKHLKLEKLFSKLDIVSNRLSLSLIVSSLIVGSSLIIQVERGPTYGGFSLLGLLGFSVAGILGLWLIISILRSGRF